MRCLSFAEHAVWVWETNSRNIYAFQMQKKRGGLNRPGNRVSTEYWCAKFVALWAEHVPDRYQHAVRYFGLLAPRSKTPKGNSYLSAVTAAKVKCPRRMAWAYSLTRDFGVDPLRDPLKPVDALGRSVRSCHGRSCIAAA